MFHRIHPQDQSNKDIHFLLKVENKDKEAMGYINLRQIQFACTLCNVKVHHLHVQIDTQPVIFNLFILFFRAIWSCLTHRVCGIFVTLS